eukprot:2313142-Amphidinium_carterae.1
MAEMSELMNNIPEDKVTRHLPKAVVYAAPCVLRTAACNLRRLARVEQRCPHLCNDWSRAMFPS